jgi:predicted ribosomally synthesized peptide with SipW-like signal peptide
MKTILSAIFTVALVSVLVGAGTFAYLTDTETSSANTFTAGELDLYMEDGGPVINSEWVMVNMKPGSGTTGTTSGKLNLWNIGTLDADHVEIYFTTVCNDLAFDAGENEESDTLDGAEGMDKYLRIVSMTYSDADDNYYPIVWQDDEGSGLEDFWDESYVVNTNDNDYIDLEDLDGVTFDNLVPPNTNGDITDNDDCEFIFTVKFDVSAPNDFQGDQCILTMSFTLNQDESQNGVVVP